MNENEFAEAVSQRRKKLYATALLYLGSEADALEAVDEAVYRALVGLKGLRRQEFFATWLTRILINVCKNELKRRARVFPMEELPETVAEEFDALPLRDAIERLPGEIREPLILRYFGGLTVSETARALSIAQGTAATRIRRALLLLRLELTEENIK